MCEEQAPILIVDDQQANIDSLIEALEPLNLKTIATQQPEEALQWLQKKQGHFAAALIDVQMPKIDGFELAQLMNNLDLTYKPPIIFLTAIHKEQIYIQKGYYLGAVDYLTKPLNLHILRSKVSVFVDIYQQYKRNTVLSQQLQASLEKLEIANKQLSSFAYLVAHDLKAPLRHLQSFVEGLFEEMSKTEQTLNKEVKEAYYDRIYSSTQRMHRIIDSILKFAQYGLAQVEKSTVNLSHLVIRCQEILAKEIKDNNVVVHLDNDLSLQVDEEKFLRVLQNLMENAIKYRSSKRTLEINISAKQEEDIAILAVEDNGMGIAPKFHQAVFKFMKRLHTEDEISGTGIGLSTCEKIVADHKGKIWVESDGESGSKFFIQLPNASVKP